MYGRFALSQWEILKKQKRSVVIDANILLFAFDVISGMPDKDSRKAKYTEAYWLLCEGNKERCFVTLEVLSEYFNRQIKDSFDLYKDQFPEKRGFKEFRSDPLGITIAQKLKTQIEQILDTNTLLNTSISADVLPGLITMYNLDFTDKLIFHTCKELNYVLMTSDSDFRQSSLDIFSDIATTHKK